MTLITRSFDIKDFNEEDRTVTGIAVPFDTPTSVGDYSEQFARGAIEGFDGVKLFWNHREVIGKVIAGRETDEGYEVTARISDTTLGRDTYTYLRDEVIDKFSVGFIPVEQRTEEDGTVTRTKVDLREVSLVPFPAYATASVSEVRAESEKPAGQSNNAANHTKEDSQESHIMENTVTIEQFDELRSRLEINERELAVVRDNGAGGTDTGLHFRSGGEFLKALGEGDDAAKTEARAWSPAGNVLADSHTSNDWKNDLLVIVNKGRPLVSAFSSGPLGAKGNYVEFPKVDSVSGTVGKQVNEGDALNRIGVKVTTDTAKVETYGAYSRLSRQAIERSDVSYLDTVLKAQANEYGKVTNKAVRDALAAASAQAGVSFTLTSATAANWIDAVLDGTQKIEDNGVLAQTADFVIASTDVWNKLARTMDDNGRPVFALNGDGSNSIGTANLRALTLSIAGLPVLRDPEATSKTFYVASADAVSTWENAGAPVRLEDESIITLSKDFALYGYMAVGVKDDNGLVKAQVA